jgi:hypothetical protein
MKGGYTARDSNQTEGPQRDELSYAAAQGTVPTRWPKLPWDAYRHSLPWHPAMLIMSLNLGFDEA